MAVSNGTQITSQQWGIVFSGISEQSSEGLGQASLLMSGREFSNTSYRSRVYSFTNTMAFSSTQAFIPWGKTMALTPSTSIQSGMLREKNHWILHSKSGNIYPQQGFMQSDLQNRGILNRHRP